MMRRAIDAEPDNIVAWNNLSGTENDLQHDEQALAAARQAAALIERGRDSALNSFFRPVLAPGINTNIDLLVGDNMGVLAEDRRLEAMPDRHSWESSFGNDLDACGALHDAACMRAALSALTKLPTGGDQSVIVQRAIVANYAEILLSHWNEASAGSIVMLSEIDKTGSVASFLRARDAFPAIALVDAHLGDLRAAHALIDKTPTDCVLCLRVRGRIDAIRKNWHGAEYWFARAVAAAPSVPFGYADWGEALLAKGDLEDAIAKFKIANEKGPHFADPLEMWGEALISENRSDLALAKFAEADKYAPNWGRLHLKWGEALLWSGKGGDAQKQFAIAHGLDLTASEKSELMGTTHG
jgi:tetratricopeptide (TPR) repeat protein